MSKAYPVVDQRPLADPPKRGPLGLLPRRREAHELPTVSAHEVMVYRVDGQYHLDTGQRRLTDDQVVEATHVSVVDLRRKTPVTVSLTIPSAEASEFTVEVVFSCTVTDPVEIVEEGLTDAGETLRAYLRSHRKFFELGLDYRLKEVNTVRRDVNAQLLAYTIERPFQSRGLRAELESVQVLTPGALAEFEEQRRTQDFDHVLTYERQRNDHTLEEQRQHFGHVLDENERDHRHEGLTADQANQLRLEKERRAFERSSARQTREDFGDDPISAAHLAYAAGGMDAVDLHRQLQQERDNRRAERRLEEARRAEERKEIRMAEKAEAREREAIQRQDHWRAMEVKLEVIRSLMQEGHTAHAIVDIDALIQEVAGTKVITTGSKDDDTPAIGAADPRKRAGPGKQTDQAGDDSDAYGPESLDDSIKGLREEDDY